MNLFKWHVYTFILTSKKLFYQKKYSNFKNISEENVEKLEPLYTARGNVSVVRSNFVCSSKAKICHMTQKFHS